MTATTPASLEVAGLLFDMDGTLVDSTAIVEEVWTRFAATYGLDVDAILGFAHGRQTKDTLVQFLPDRSAEELAAIEVELTAGDDRDDGVVEIPGAAALVARIAALGAPWAVVTSAPRDLAARRLHAVGIAVPSVLIGAEDADPGKPAPDGYQDAAAQLGVPIEACVVFEDAEAGIQAAIDSGGVPVVVGGLQSSNTVGLRRVADLTDVTVAPQGDRILVSGV